MMTDISSYLDFVVLLFFAFGIAFETPVATVLLVASGLVSLKTMKKNRGYVLLGIFVVAAFLTPPDAISQTAMAVPMYLLYEVGILLGRIGDQGPAGPAGRGRGDGRRGVTDRAATGLRIRYARPRDC